LNDSAGSLVLGKCGHWFGEQGVWYWEKCGHWFGEQGAGIGENVVWGATHLSSYLFVTKQNPDRSNQDITLITSVLI